MGKDGTSVDIRVVSAATRLVSGEQLNVAAVAREIGTSRQTIYRYAARIRAEGVQGAFVRSRAPHSHPGQVRDEVADAVELARKDLDASGWEHGALSIWWWLQDHPERWRHGPLLEQVPVPSRATIHRILQRRGLVVPQPQKRPRRAGRRFTRPAANDLWQMDGFEVALADGTVVVVIELIDDLSRLLLASRACRSENAADAWAVFCTAVDAHGLPRQLLTDNGTAFNGHRRGWTARLEAAVTELGVEPLTARPGHPQTCGKVERHHATCRRWLKRRPAPGTLLELQQLLDTYPDLRNHRRHQGLDWLTPLQVWALAPRSGPAAGGPTAIVTTRPVSPAGCIVIDHSEISLGRKHAGQEATVFRTGEQVLAFINGQLARELVIDRSRRYQPLNR